MLMKNMEEFTQCNGAYCDIADRTCEKPVKPIGNNVAKTSKYYNFKDNSDKHPLQLLGYTNNVLFEKQLCKLSNLCYISYQEFNITSSYNLYNKLLDDLNKTKTKVSDDLLLDPIYAVIFQDDSEYIQCLIDEDDNTNRLLKFYIIYPRYYDLDNGKFIKSKQETVQTVMKSVATLIPLNNIADTSKGTVYKLNKSHKMFYDLLEKKGNIIL